MQHKAMLSRTIASILPDTRTMRTLMAMLVLAGFGCGVAAAQTAPGGLPAASAPAATTPVPLPRPRPKVGVLPSWIATLWHEPRTFREAAGEDFQTSEVTSAPSPCRVRLEKFAVIAAMPRLIGPGACGGGDIVRVDAVLVAGRKVEIKPAPYLQCPMAEQLALWVRDDTTPLLAAIGGSMKSLETYDDFSCRGRNRKLFGKVSEHGKANAIDLKGFTLQDGRYIHLTDMKADKPLREGARVSACGRFKTVLGPGSDGYHEEHIHIDLAERRGDYKLCQWDVREPPPPPKPKVPEKDGDKPDEKPPEKPAEVAAVTEPAKPEPVKPEPARPAPTQGQPQPQIIRPTTRAEPVKPVPAQPQIITRPEPRPQVAAAPEEADDEEEVEMTMVSPIQGAIPLPKAKPRPRVVRRKSRDDFHFPFNLLR
ncbi:MAG: extensin family protein [Pseudolabrys sp.]|nr:extensin family protein [Pseudolabrys sp.]